MQASNICQVCGDKASINNYGALSCLPCRTFFRRNAFRNKRNFVCRYDDNCEVNVLTRKTCTACRLRKCIAVGMSHDLIRKEDLSSAKGGSGKSKQRKLAVMTIPQQSALDLAHGGNRSYLNTSDWRIISNVVHAFDTFTRVSELRRVIQNLNISASSFQFDVSQSLHLISSFYTSLQSFIGSTPDFKVLTQTEQRSLFQRNMLGLLSIGGLYLLHESGIFDKPDNELIILPLYGTEATQQAKLICEQFNCDSIPLKLMLVALAFSSNCYTIHNHINFDKDSLLFGTFRLFGSQNVYVELIWNYLMQTYGYNDAVQKFCKLIKQLLSSLQISIDMYENNEIHQTFIHDMIEQIETSSIINDKDMVPLWGKKL